MGHDDSWAFPLPPRLLPSAAVALSGYRTHQTACSGGLRERREVRGVGARSRMSGEEADSTKPQGGVHYGTFQGPPSYPPPRPPPVGFPQPAPPPGLSAHHRGGYQAVPARDYEAGVRGHSHDRLPCCGIGFGWFLFIVGFFLGAIPWYVGALLLWCSSVDDREKPGYVACTVAAILATIAVIIGAAAGTHVF